MKIIAKLIDKVLSNIDNESVIAEVNKSVRDLWSSFKLYEKF